MWWHCFCWWILKSNRWWSEKRVFLTMLLTWLEFSCVIMRSIVFSVWLVVQFTLFSRLKDSRKSEKMVVSASLGLFILMLKSPSNVIWPGLVMSLSSLSDSSSVKDVTLELGGLYIRCKWFDSCSPLFPVEKTAFSRFGVHGLSFSVAFISSLCITAIPPPYFVWLRERDTFISWGTDGVCG